MKQVGGECPLQGIMPTGKGTPGQEARVFLAFHVLLPLDKGKKCIYALRESSKAWQVIWVFPDVEGLLDVFAPFEPIVAGAVQDDTAREQRRRQADCIDLDRRHGR